MTSPTYSSKDCRKIFDNLNVEINCTEPQEKELSPTPKNLQKIDSLASELTIEENIQIINAE